MIKLVILLSCLCFVSAVRNVEVCDQEIKTDIVLKLGEVIWMKSKNYPAKMEGPCNRTIRAPKDSEVFIKFIHADLNGKIGVTNVGEKLSLEFANTARSADKEKTALAFKMLGDTADFEYDYFEASEWNGFYAQIMVVDPGSQSCPPAVNPKYTDKIVASEPVYIASNYKNIQNMTLKPMTQAWELTRDDPLTSVLKVGFTRGSMLENEKVVITDGVSTVTITAQNETSIGFPSGPTPGNGNYWAVNSDNKFGHRLQSNDEITRIYYFGGPTVTLTFDRVEKNISVTRGQSFEAVISAIPTVAKTCSLLYNGITFKELSKTFTNVNNGQLYKPNELCTWMVQVPPNSSFDFHQTFGDYEDRYDYIQIKLPDEVVCALQADHPTLHCLPGKLTAGYTATFQWGTDGTAGYKGFEIKYDIQSLTATTLRPATVPPATIASIVSSTVSEGPTESEESTISKKPTVSSETTAPKQTTESKKSTASVGSTVSIGAPTVGPRRTTTPPEKPITPKAVAATTKSAAKHSLAIFEIILCITLFFLH